MFLIFMRKSFYDFETSYIIRKAFHRPKSMQVSIHVFFLHFFLT